MDKDDVATFKKRDLELNLTSVKPNDSKKDLFDYSMLIDYYERIFTSLLFMA